MLRAVVGRLERPSDMGIAFQDRMDSELATRICEVIGRKMIVGAEPDLRRFVPKHAIHATPEARATAIWALGMLHERTPDKELVSALELRVFDQNPLDPEAAIVRLHSVVAIGRMKAVEKLNSLRNRYENDGTEVKAAARWAIMNMTGEK